MGIIHHRDEYFDILDALEAMHDHLASRLAKSGVLRFATIWREFAMQFATHTINLSKKYGREVLSYTSRITLYFITLYDEFMKWYLIYI